MRRNILVTGGAGFIGCNLVKHLINKYPDYYIVVYDALTYAGDEENLRDVAGKFIFVKGDICNTLDVRDALELFQIDSIIHLAAESHVDRSINNPNTFVTTNVNGTVSLLNAAKDYWNGNYDDKLFYHVSTDEVYGSIEEGHFSETSNIDPRSPYSASKASSDMFVLSYFNTYNLPVVVSRCSNNYGENQFPEKLLPVLITNILNNKPLPIYGDGKNVRDWLYVGDHANAIDTIFHFGNHGEVYNIGGNCELENLDFVHLLCNIMDDKLTDREIKSSSLITYVKDRAGHDRRYAISSEKLQTKLGWRPKTDIYTGLYKTVDWYLANQDWLKGKIGK